MASENHGPPVDGQEKVANHIAALRRKAPCDASGKKRSPMISTCIGLMPEQMKAFMEHGSVLVTRSLSAKFWKTLCDAADELRRDCILSPFGIIGHDVVALHAIDRPKNDEDRAIVECKFFATVNAPKLRRERTLQGVVLICLDVRLDYAGMMHPDRWPPAFRPPGGGQARSPF
jgi:hypothetical protein